MAREITKNFKTAEECDFLVELYMEGQKLAGEPPTHAGLALALGLTSRQMLYELQDVEEFTDSIKKARLMIEDFTARKAMKNNGAGAIFMLKNMGYTDKQQIQLDPVKVTISGSDADLG